MVLFGLLLGSSIYTTASVFIVKAIIAMAHGLSMKVVTEGVETAEQLAFLRQHGCEQYQGYIFSKPLLTSEVAEKRQRTSTTQSRPIQ